MHEDERRGCEGDGAEEGADNTSPEALIRSTKVVEGPNESSVVITSPPRLSCHDPIVAISVFTEHASRAMRSDAGL